MGIMRGTVPLERQEVEQCGRGLAKNHNVSVSCENIIRVNILRSEPTVELVTN